MINKSVLLKEIAAVYQRHSWTLRRLLITENTGAAAAELIAKMTVNNVSVKTAEFDALWFSRVVGERESWELRLAQTQPFALFESFDRKLPEAEREKRLLEMEERMKQQSVKRQV